MRTATLTDAGTVEVQDSPRPEPDPDELLVAVDACGVCTTDFHMYSGSLTVEYPMVAGHESAGEIVEVGKEVTGFERGERVAINPSVPCNECRACKAGRENLCHDLTSIGGAATNIVEGAFAEYVRVPAGNVEPIGDLPSRTAAFAEPLGCCINGLDQVDLHSGETALVAGAGTIGLLLVQLLRFGGAGRIVVSEPLAERREMALATGADHAVDPTETDVTTAVPDLVGDVDVAIEAVGIPAVIEQAHELTGPGGRTLVLRLHAEDEFSAFDLFFDEQQVLGTYSLTRDAFARAVTLLRNGRIDTDTLVTDEFGLDGLETAFEEMKARNGLKKMIHPRR
jgi:NADPH2:quinone reductase